MIDFVYFGVERRHTSFLLLVQWPRFAHHWILQCQNRKKVGTRLFRPSTLFSGCPSCGCAPLCTLHREMSNYIKALFAKVCWPSRPVSAV